MRVASKTHIRSFENHPRAMKQEIASRDGAVVTAPASQKTGSGAIVGVDAICVLSLLLVLVHAPRDFPPGTPVSPSPPKNNIKFQFDLESVPIL